MKTDDYEAEVKYEISEDDLAGIQDTLQKLGFTYTGKETLEDYYISTERSRYGGWDFVRLRKSNDKYILTQKVWQQDANGVLIRQEDEKVIADSSANEMLRKEYVARLIKTRAEYTGSVDAAACTTCIDSIELNGKVRYFLECERITKKDEVATTRQQLRRWVGEHLAIDASVEAPSMLELVMQSTS